MVKGWELSDFRAKRAWKQGTKNIVLTPGLLAHILRKWFYRQLEPPGTWTPPGYTIQPSHGSMFLSSRAYLPAQRVSRAE